MWGQIPSSLRGDSGAGRHLEQEARPAGMRRLSMRLSVGSNHTHTQRTLPSGPLPLRVQICWSPPVTGIPLARGYMLPSHLPSAALTGSPVPRARPGLHCPEGPVACMTPSAVPSSSCLPLEENHLPLRNRRGHTAVPLTAYSRRERLL